MQWTEEQFVSRSGVENYKGSSSTWPLTQGRKKKIKIHNLLPSNLTSRVVCIWGWKHFFLHPYSRIFQELFNKLDTIVSFVFCCYIFFRLGHKMTWHKKTTKKLLLEKLLAETLNCFGQSFLEAYEFHWSSH